MNPARSCRPAAGLLALALSLAWLAPSSADPVRYVRFAKDGITAYGIVKDGQVEELDGDLFASPRPNGKTHALAEVTVLVPTEPRHVLALAGNYRSHLDASAEIPPKFRIIQPFHKGPSSLAAHEAPIILPKDAREVHYEAELVIVIGKTCSKVTREQAMEYVFGVTAGNDVSERIWQNDPEAKDVQWWRAKGSDTFGPVGPFILVGADYGNLLLRLRLNGEVKQEERTDHLIHDIPAIVSGISRHVTLQPGDLIFTGTPGETSGIRPGDVVEVELEGVGVLRNPVVAEP
jgi:2-keto-4-pentenoate hydratase/2-oxohepta-3-ene-1,7-dioic acid hydratase in catechol pathway